MSENCSCTALFFQLIIVIIRKHKKDKYYKNFNRLVATQINDLGFGTQIIVVVPKNKIIKPT